MNLETAYYFVTQIDGDYAHLQRVDLGSEEPKLVARALLPEGTGEGSMLKYEMLQYELMKPRQA